MANFVLSSRSRFARNIILVENNSFRSLPLLVAAERYVQLRVRATDKWSLQMERIDFGMGK